MKYCRHCGSELKGAKRFCIICGKSQDKSEDDKKQSIYSKSKDKSTDLEDGKCIKCHEDSDKTCFFCNKYVCREHYTRLQANVHPYIKMQQYLAENESKVINEGWRGLIAVTCPNCLRLKVGKQLTDDETEKISTVDECTWYKLDSQMR
jgi:hypothetical protein